MGARSSRQSPYGRHGAVPAAHPTYLSDGHAALFCVALRRVPRCCYSLLTFFPRPHPHARSLCFPPWSSKAAARAWPPPSAPHRPTPSSSCARCAATQPPTPRSHHAAAPLPLLPCNRPSQLPRTWLGHLQLRLAKSPPLPPSPAHTDPPALLSLTRCVLQRRCRLPPLPLTAGVRGWPASGCL